MAGIDILHVPYKGSSQALTDLIAGRISMIIDNAPSAISFIKAGRLRALGVTGSKRSPTLADVPTIAEAGLPGYESLSWSGIAAPAGTPKDVVARLNREIAKILTQPDIRDNWPRQVPTRSAVRHRSSPSTSALSARNGASSFASAASDQLTSASPSRNRRRGDALLHSFDLLHVLLSHSRDRRRARWFDARAACRPATPCRLSHRKPERAKRRYAGAYLSEESGRASNAGIRASIWPNPIAGATHALCRANRGSGAAYGIH
jgi:hypothetical protein